VGFVENGRFDQLAQVGGDRAGFAGGRGGAGFAGKERSGDLEAVEEPGGSGGVEVVGGDAAEDLGSYEQGGGAVFDHWEDEGLGRVEVAEFAGCGSGAAGGVMEVAELLVAQGG
jgi:hypothetical protein